jgi:hypothetical protein
VTYPNTLITTENYNDFETSPGKFEGERLIVQLAYEAYLLGFADELGTSGVLVSYVQLDDDPLHIIYKIAFVEDEQGFVCEVDPEVAEENA